jgi:serine/threonine-protein kinase
MLGQVLLDKYRVNRPLDEGGMSKLYLARQLDQPRDVVVKVLKEPLRAQPKTVEHFRREIHITSRFQHPNSVAVFDSMPKSPYGPVLIMEYLRGVDLNTLWHREGRFSADRIGRILGQLCDVLQDAHDEGIVHRDLKPGNVMMLYPGTPQETVKLMDFGLAKMSSMLYISPDEIFDFSLPAAAGTPEYISPEMVRGTELDSRADLYSVGVILYELLSGKRPFQRSSVEALMLAQLEEEPPSFADLGLKDAIAPAIEDVVKRCMAKYPEQRFKGAWDVALAYEKALGRRILQPRAKTRADSSLGTPATGTSTQTRPMTPAAERNSVRHVIEANMPEVMAMLKLKGFISDLGGEIVESLPGLIKVRLGEKQQEKRSGGGLFGWIGGGSAQRQNNVLQGAKGTDLELHMERKDANQPNKLTLTLVMRPQNGIANTEWKVRCDKINRDLQAYLMGR